MDEQQIQALQEAMEEFRKNGQLSADTLKKLDASANPAANSLEKVTKASLGVASKFGSLGKEIMQGEGGFKSLGGSISALTGVVGKLLGALPLVGGAAKALAEGVGEAAKFVLDQMDIMAKNYQSLGESSAIASDGVDGLRRQFRQMGLVSLPAFGKAVSQNTQGLAIWGTNVSQGAEELSKLSGALTSGQMAEQFFKMGMSMDSVGEAAANYVSAFARYGGLQRNTTMTGAQAQEALTKSTQKYIEEVDLIAKMTGNTRAQQEQEQKKSLVDARFRAKILEMQQNGQEKEAEQLTQYVNGLGGAAGDAARALVTGVPMTEEAANANLLFQGQIRDSVIALQNGAKATTEIEKSMRGGAEGVNKFGKLIQYSGTESFGQATVQALDFASAVQRANKEGISIEEAARKIQEDNLKNTGKTTQEFVEAQKATAQASKDLQNLGFTLASKAVPAVNSFATALQKVTGWIDSKFGGAPAGGGTAAAVRSGRSVGGGPASTAQGLTGAAAKNLNPGNLRFAGQKGATQGTGGFAAFETVDDGLVALANQLNLYLTGKSSSGRRDTISSIISAYAPPNENDTQTYIKQMADFMGVDPEAKLGSDPKTMAKLMVGIIGKESMGGLKNGYNFRSGIQTAVAQVLGVDPSQIGEFATGGISRGPRSGYPAMLHGTEAVIPLPDGKAIQVEMPGFMNSMENQTGLLAEQIAKMDELISVMRNQVDVSHKILRVQT